MNEKVEELISKETVEAKIGEMARRLSKDYKGKELILVCILKGAVVFFSELIKSISIPLTLDFLQVESYRSGTVAGEIKLKKDIDSDISGKHVLLVEDIVDTGKTLDFLLKELKKRGPASVKICALLDKKPRREVVVPLDYVCFDVPDKFIVGYGIDFDGKHRNLPYIGALK